LTATLHARYSREVTAKLHEIYRAIKGARRVLVTSEPYPDGDAFGTEIALDQVCRHAFATAGRADGRVYLVNERGCPRKYRFMPGSDKIRSLDSVMERDFDVGIVVDGGSERAGAAKELFDRCRTRIYLDHHKFGSRETYDISLSDPDATSTTQIVYGFFADPEIAVPLTKEAAEAIYLGLIYDTGSFQYSLTKPLTHEIAARLMEAGIDFARIHEKALLTQEFEELMVIGRVVASAERCGDRGDIVWAAITNKIIREHNIAGDDLNKIIQTLCFVEGIEVAIIFREQEGTSWKLSLRSRGKVDVAAIARELDPNGGGHDRAAGCSLEGKLEDVAKRATEFVNAKLKEKRV
jgi:bifunctional oligoribonuclease and PAP phosphatase NrnA